MHLRKLPFILLFLLSSLFVFAQGDSVVMHKSYAHMRISFIECGPGLETWETFGHSCLRVIDSTVQGPERDKVYNYGFFEVSEDNTIFDQLVAGRIIDLLDTITYDELMAEYTFKGRSLKELVLLLDSVQTEKVYLFLRDNLRREKRYYEFDSFYDNCTTRISDLFFNLFGSAFVPGKVLPPDNSVTFRDLTVGPLCARQYKFWTGLATNLIYGSPTDKVISEKEALHFPPFLFDALKSATIDGRPIGGDIQWIQKDKVKWEKTINWPFGLFVIVAAGIMLTMSLPRFRVLGKVLGSLLLIITGVLGCCLLYTSGFDGDPAWKHNYNVLWALPTNLIFPFLGKKIKPWYAIVALILLFCALLINIFEVQVMPLFDLAPLFLALVWIYAFSCRFRTRPQI